MKNLNLTVLLCFCLAMAGESLMAQDAEHKELITYWRMRNRFFGDGTAQYPGFISLGNGTQPGQNIPAEQMWLGVDCSVYWHLGGGPFGCPNNPGTSGLKWGDATCYLGNYIAVMATEYALMSAYGNSAGAAQAQMRVREAFVTYNRLIAQAYADYGEPVDYSEPFFVRDDIGAGFPTLSNGNQRFPGISCVASAGSCMAPNTTKYVSQDQFIGLLWGLSFVIQYMPNPERQEARNIVSNFVSWLAGNNWFIEDPDGNLHNGLGVDCRWFSFPLAQACFKLTGQNHHNLFSVTIGQAVWQQTMANFLPNLYGGPIITPAVSVPAGVFAGIPYPAFTVPSQTLTPYTRGNMVMMMEMATFSDTWNKGMLSSAAFGTEDYIIDLADDLLNNTGTSANNEAALKAELAAAPCDGPCHSYATDPNFPPFTCNAGGNWRSPNRWSWIDSRKSLGDPWGGQGLYNGLDYMLLYNLYHLKYYLPAGINYRYADIGNTLVTETNTFPRHIYNDQNNYYFTITDNRSVYGASINCTSLVTTIAGSVGEASLRARDQVNLLPGFTVTNSAQAHIFIEPIACNVTTQQLEKRRESPPPITDPDKHADPNGDDKHADLNEDDKWMALAYPNPFSDEIEFQYTLPQSSELELKIFTATGQEVAVLFRGNADKGTHKITHKADKMAAGVYYFSIHGDGFTEVQKIVLIR